MLFLIFCKVAEPLISVVRFEQTTDEATSFIQNENDIFEVKAYLSIPYHSENSTESITENNVYQHEGQFYNIVEKRFANDTLYLKLQNNLSARDRFTSLTEVVKEMSLHKDMSNKNTPSKKSAALNLEDLSKVFLPTSAPEIKKCNVFYSVSLPKRQSWDVTPFLTSAYLSILSPPPQA
jgi:hypothetical protein